MNRASFLRVRARSGAIAFTALATLIPTWFFGSVAGVAVSELWSQRLDSDRDLFRHGGSLLLESLRAGMPFVRGAGTLAAPTLGLLAFGSLLLWSALLDTLATSPEARRTPADFAAASTRHVGVFAAIFAISTLLRACLAGVTVLLVQGVAPALARDATERGRTLTAVGAGVVGWLLFEGLRLVQDLALVARARHESTLVGSALVALGVFRDRFAALAMRKTLYLLVAAALVALGVFLPSSLWEQRGAVAMRAIVHQGVLFALVVWRAVWLASLIEEIGPRPEPWPPSDPEDESPAASERGDGANVNVDANAAIAP